MLGRQRSATGGRKAIPGLVTTVLSAAVTLSCAGVGVAVFTSASPGSLESAGQAARVDPRPAPRYAGSDYTTHIDNAWFPLKAGTTYVYRGVEADGHTRDVFRVTGHRISIAGVRCRVIRDRVYLNGRLRERTRDYYTQDDEGNVWYFGEDTAELNRRGQVTSREGTWRTGRHGAEAGIFMQANPQVGSQFQQEFFKGHAEDHFKVLSLTAAIDVPYGHFGHNKLRRNVVLTKEWTPLEPRIRDHKYYVRGVGEVKETTVKGPTETLELVKIRQR